MAVQLYEAGILGGPGAAAAAAGTAYGRAVLAPHPLLWAGLRDTAGIGIADLSGFGHVGTYVGGPLLNQAGLVNDPGASPASASVLFSATKYGKIPNAAWMDVGRSFTLACWLKRAGGPGALDEFLCGPTPMDFGAGAQGFGIAISSFNTVATAFFVTQDGFGAWDGGADVTDGARHLFLFTYDADAPGGAAITTYTDNANMTVYNPPIGGAIVAPTVDFTLGILGDFLSRGYTGYLEDVILYGHAISAAARTAIWTLGS